MKTSDFFPIVYFDEALGHKTVFRIKKSTFCQDGFKMSDILGDVQWEIGGLETVEISTLRVPDSGDTPARRERDAQGYYN